MSGFMTHLHFNRAKIVFPTIPHTTVEGHDEVEWDIVE